jgi:PAS domain S-box-containing protein
MADQESMSRRGSEGATEQIRRFTESPVPRFASWLQVLIVTVTLAAIVAALFLSDRSQRETTRLATEQFNQQQLILARSAAVGIEHFIADVEDDLLALSNFPVVQRMKPGILERMEVLYTGFPPETSSRRLDKNGILRFIYPNEGWRKDLIGQDYSGEAFFQQVKKTGEVVVSGLIINEVGERRIRVARLVCIEDEEGTSEFNGIIIDSFDPDTLASLYISPILSGETGYAWLLNENGLFLAHHEEEFVGEDAFKVRAETNPELFYDSINNIQRQMMNGEEGVGRYASGWHRGERGEIEKLVAYTPVRVGDHLWSVAVCAPVDEVEWITSKAYRNELYTLGFIVLIMAAAGASFFIAFYRWTRSLEQEVETRRRAEERVVHLNAVLRAVRNVNQLITKIKDREKLLQGACDNLIETRGYHSAWIALMEEDGGFVTTAQAGVSKDFPAVIDRLKRGELLQCIREAVEQSGVVVVENPAIECVNCPLAGTYASRARAIARLEYESHVYGFLTVTVPVEMAADDEERSLFGEVAEDIAFALHSIEVEAEREEAREALHKSNRALRTLSECNEFLVRATDESGLLHGICRILVDIGGYRLTWVGFAEQDEEKSVRPVAQVGHEEGYLDTLDITWADTEQGRGPTGTAIRTGKPVVARNILTDPDYAPWRAEATKRGYAASIALPLIANGQTLGALNIYTVESDAFDAEEVKLLGELAADLAYGIRALRSRAERERAEEALKEAKENYRMIVEDQTEFIVRFLPDGTCVFANEAYYRFFGKKREELVGQNMTVFAVEEDHEKVRKHLTSLCQDNPVVTTENRVIKGDGKTRWVQWTNRAKFDAQGNVVAYQSVGRDITDRKQAEEALRRSFIQLAETVSRAMESQDPYTAGHQRQVAELARMVGEKLGLEPDRLQGIYIAGLLHDIGKISIPAEILTHPGKLSDAEWTLIRTHPRRGYEILEQVEFPWPVGDIALHHHERLDGTGYPDGLKGDQLSLEVRILGVCDVVDAMSSHRPYRPGRPNSAVIAELRAGKGTKYDPKVVDILIGIIESGEPIG